MNRALKKLDVLIAVGIGLIVSLLAFGWAFPYPHPDLWPILSDLRFYLNLTALGVLGRLGIGLFAGITYIVMRIAWLLGLDVTDEYPDKFVFNQLVPALAALLCATMPAIWRSAQFLSPNFLFLLIEMCAVLGWLLTRGSLKLLAYSISYGVLGLVAGVNPFALAVLIFALICDCIARWQGSMFHGQKEDDEAELKSSQQELVFSSSSSAVGFIAGMFVLARFARLHDFSWDVPRILGMWQDAWLSAFDRTFTSPFMLTIICMLVAVAVGMAFGRRIRAVDAAGLTMAWFMTATIAFVVLIVIGRAQDGDARARLAMIQRFAHELVDDAKGVRWLFTDGRFDDILRYECAKTGQDLVILDIMNPPKREDVAILKGLAPEIADRAIFSAGGAEIFRAWARERPERLEESAWLFGGGILRQFGKVQQHACGLVLRAKPKDGDDSFTAANARQEKMFDDVQDIVCHSSRWRHAFGGVDTQLREKFDALMWRVARQAAIRSDELAAVGELTQAQTIRERIQKLNEANDTLRLQGTTLERLLPTANLVVTAREGLEIALKRADFVLAQRYAHEVLASSSEDVPANFALGMVNLEFKNYREAARRFERALLRRPDEPAALNNLALCYLKIGRIEKAKDAAEKALSLHPDSPEIKKNLAEIEKAEKAR